MAECKSNLDRTEYQRAYREANKERLAEYAKAYRSANRERQKELSRAHYLSNAEEYKERAKAWAQANPDKRKAIVANWADANPELQQTYQERAYQKHRDKRVAECKVYREKNQQKLRDLNAAWKAQNPAANAHHVGLRRARRVQATPPWADLEAIKAIYEEAADRRRETGEAWHVDHEIPLTHPLVCGLHNEFNLRVIRASENLAKRNKFTV